MNIDQPLLQKIAHLAQLELDKIAEAAVLEDLNNIVHLMNQLHEVDTLGILPLATMSPEQDVTHEDVGEAPLTQERSLANAPKKDTDYFRVPKVKE